MISNPLKHWALAPSNNTFLQKSWERNQTNKQAQQKTALSLLVYILGEMAMPRSVAEIYGGAPHAYMRVFTSVCLHAHVSIHGPRLH